MIMISWIPQDAHFAATQERMTVDSREFPVGDRSMVGCKDVSNFAVLVRLILGLLLMVFVMSYLLFVVD